ncbi:MAG: CARDB domain-containing protein [Candidatus Nanohaloarchaea archaeon]|nr:CARDB domain-containing protein [Candidatus Nanohaloarchaea archaeon]
MRGRAGRWLLVLVVVAALSGSAAAANAAITDVEAPSFVESGETAKITVTVKNTASEDVHQMEVTASGFGQVQEHNLWGLDPGEEDTVQFYLDAPEDQPGTHEVELTVQSRDSDGNVIGGTRRNISIDVEESGVVVEPEEGDLRIREVAMPASVMAGETITMDVTVRNTGQADMGGLHVAVDAFGRTTRTSAGSIDGKTSRTVPVKIPVPAAARGREEARIEVSTYDAVDTMNATIVVSDVHATLNLRQETVSVGDHVTVSGILSRRNTRADLFFSGDFEAPVFSDETGHYTHTIIPQSPGVHSVRLTVGSASVEKFLTVRPRLGVEAVSAPDRVGTGSIFDVCARLSRSTAGEASVRLVINGETRETATVLVRDSTQHCFATSIPERGNHTVMVAATAGDVTARKTTAVTAVETGLAADVTPDQLTLTQGQAGVFQVRIENDRLQRRAFDVTTSGLGNVSVQTPGTVTLNRGATRTTAVRVVPERTGRYSGRIRVSAGGTTITEQPVTVRAVQNPALRNPVIGGAVESAEAAADAFTDLPQRQKWMVLGAAGIALLLLGWYWRRRRGGVIEPQY